MGCTNITTTCMLCYHPSAVEIQIYTSFLFFYLLLFLPFFFLSYFPAKSLAILMGGV